MTVRIDCTDGRERPRAVTAAIAALRRGDLVILPTENTYVLATDPFSSRGTRALRAAKGQRDATPLGLLIPRPGTVPGIAADVPVSARTLMATFWPGMVTLLLEPQPTLAWDHPCGSPVAVRVPAHPIALDAGTLDARWSDDEDPDLPSTIVDVRGDAAEVLRHGAISEERIRAALAATA